MCSSVKFHNIRDTTKDMEQVEARVKASMSRTVTLPTSSSSSMAGGRGSASASMSRIPSEPKRRRELNIVDQAFKMEAREELDAAIARMFFTVVFAFNLSKNPYYTKSFTYATSNSITG